MESGAWSASSENKGCMGVLRRITAIDIDAIGIWNGSCGRYRWLSACTGIIVRSPSMAFG